ncbi:HIRAN domain-containing protein [Atopobacter phocae]|uniref:HIRAN domain-containing protein n=1 Tax=Atopobacter phocae TaxID=136492 RepID=UPI0004701CFE|nr:HIRAN domain-containing protein [Atopobacter phocae]
MDNYVHYKPDFFQKYFLVYDEETYQIVSSQKEVAKQLQSKLNKKFFKTKSVKEQLSLIERDLLAMEESLSQYESDIKRSEYLEQFIVYKKSFYVKGTTFSEHFNEVVKKIIEETSFSAFEGMTNKEIEEDGGKIYKHTGYTRKFRLESEPDNPHDKNAIAVFIDNMHVGYVPKEIAKEIQHLLNERYELSGITELVGGPYKEYDYSKDKVVTTKNNYGLKMDIAIRDTFKNVDGKEELLNLYNEIEKGYKQGHFSKEFYEKMMKQKNELI